MTISTDLFHGLGAGINGPYDVLADDEPQGSRAPHNGDRVAFLYNHYGRAPLSAVQAAGLQLAIWELLYDADASEPLGNFGSGDFSIISASSGALFEAQTYLSESFQKSESAVFLNVEDQPEQPTTSRTLAIIASGSFNFGNVPAAKIGNLVWHDKNVNGLKEQAEPASVAPRSNCMKAQL